MRLACPDVAANARGHAARHPHCHLVRRFRHMRAEGRSGPGGAESQRPEAVAGDPGIGMFGVLDWAGGSHYVYGATIVLQWRCRIWGGGCRAFSCLSETGGAPYPAPAFVQCAIVWYHRGYLAGWYFSDAASGLDGRGYFVRCGVCLSAGLRLPPALRGAGHRSAVRWGVLLALLAGCGQGFGAALSRLAQAEAVREGLVVTGIGQAFLRVLPGMGFALLTWCLSMKLPNWLGGRRGADDREFIPGANKVINRRAWLWLLVAATCGPIGGVSCFQWALGELRSGVVLSITATTPLLVMPLSYWLEQDRPGWRGVLGAIIAVAGVIGMVVAA